MSLKIASDPFFSYQNPRQIFSSGLPNFEQNSSGRFLTSSPFLIVFLASFISFSKFYNIVIKYSEQDHRGDTTRETFNGKLVS
jgi:hypothetical protein